MQTASMLDSKTWMLFCILLSIVVKKIFKKVVDK